MKEDSFYTILFYEQNFTQKTEHFAEHCLRKLLIINGYKLSQVDSNHRWQNQNL